MNNNHKTVKSTLILEDGTRFRGNAFGYLKDSEGYVIFSSCSSSFQEVITDPAGAGRIIVMTYPSVGNYGFNLEDMESSMSKIKGIVVREKCEKPSNWRCEMEIDGFLRQQRIPGIEGIDTRELVKHIRDRGSMKGIITLREDELTESQIKQKFTSINMNIPTSSKEKYKTGEGNKNLAVIDLGIKNSVLRRLTKEDMGLNISVYPHLASYEQIMEDNPDALLISSGPGNPDELNSIVTLIEKFIGKIPIFGIGLGCVLIGMAFGGQPSKLHYGHHSTSITVKDTEHGQLFVTNQNHDFTIENLPETPGLKISFTNVNDKTAEGISYYSEGNLMAYGTLFYPDTTPDSSRKRNTGFFYTKLKNALKGGDNNA